MAHQKPLRRLGLTAALAFGLATSSFAFDWTQVLSEENEQELPSSAARLYEEALELADHIDYPNAVRTLVEAGEAAPEHIELQFVIVRWARYMGEVSYGDTSLRYFDYAEEALRRLLSNSAIGPEERSRALTEATRVRGSKDSLRERDQERMESGGLLVDNIRSFRIETASGPYADNLRERERGDVESREREEEEKEPKANPFAKAPGEDIQLSAAPQAIRGAAGGLNPQFGGADPFGGGADPFAAGGGGADPFGGGADPFAAGGGGADPFGGGGGADPFGGGGGADPFGGGGGADPFGGGGK
ncbi:MAG: hypothetical protein RLY93_12980 [Sumerlaeia bacterium]